MAATEAPLRNPSIHGAAPSPSRRGGLDRDSSNERTNAIQCCMVLFCPHHPADCKSSKTLQPWRALQGLPGTACLPWTWQNLPWSWQNLPWSWQNPGNRRHTRRIEAVGRAASCQDRMPRDDAEANLCSMNRQDNRRGSRRGKRSSNLGRQTLFEPGLLCVVHHHPTFTSAAWRAWRLPPWCAGVGLPLQHFANPLLQLPGPNQQSRTFCSDQSVDTQQ